ncbi:MAG: hypothetical protein HA491_00850 [Candidatus Verstraetearchaeota archaeon]|nr:hypothetical protein [Candidatus Verstraetearchaeota archaeon]
MEKKEAEEIREMLSAVSKFLEDIKKPIADLINVMLDAMRRDRVGEEVAAFYKKLKESGLPDDVVRDMVRKYLEERVKIASLLDKLIGSMGRPRELRHQGRNATGGAVD